MASVGKVEEDWQCLSRFGRASRFRRCEPGIWAIGRLRHRWESAAIRFEITVSRTSCPGTRRDGFQTSESLPVLRHGAGTAQPWTQAKILLGRVLPEMVVGKPAGDSAKPGGALRKHLPELREDIHDLRKQSPALLLPPMLYRTPIWKLCLGMINMPASA